MDFIATISAALILSLALPNEFASYGAGLLGFICLAPYFCVVSRSRSYGRAAALGAVFGAVSHASSSYWLYFFKDFAFWTLGSTTIAYGLLQAIVALYIRYFSQPRRLGARATTALRPFLLAAIWTVWEWAKSIGFLGYPWGLIAYALNGAPVMIQIVDGYGVYFLSFLLALANASISEAAELLMAPKAGRRSIFRAWLGGIAILAVLSIWTGVYGWYRLSHPTPVVDRVPMVLVQPNEDSWARGGEMTALQANQNLTRAGLATLAAGQAALAGGQRWTKPALVAWSETILQRPYEEFRPFFQKNPTEDPFMGFLAEIDVPLLTGAPVILNWEKYDATNSALLIDSQGAVTASYAKRHPVPFAESIPFWEYQWMRDFMKEAVGLSGGWVMGSEAVVMEVPTPSGRPLRFGVPICFEDAFADVCADFFRGGADILINLTNDSWSRTNSAEIQHLVAARFRAIENRRVLVRSTNAGVTAVIDAEGQIIAELPLFVAAALAVAVPVQRTPQDTVYFILGDWFPAFLLCAIVAYRLLESWPTIRSRGFRSNRSARKPSGAGDIES